MIESGKRAMPFSVTVALFTSMKQSRPLPVRKKSMRSPAFIRLSLTIVSGIMPRTFGQELKEPFSLVIVPSERHEERATLVFNKPYAPYRHRHDHVVLTNISDKPQKLWNESCSWGYGRLSFEVTDKEGNVKQVKKVEKVDRDKNYEDWFFLPPGEHVVFDVLFDQTWENVPRLEKGVGSADIKVRAFYRLEDRVVESPEVRSTIYAD